MKTIKHNRLVVGHQILSGLVGRRRQQLLLHKFRPLVRLQTCPRLLALLQLLVLPRVLWLHLVLSLVFLSRLPHVLTRHLLVRTLGAKTIQSDQQSGLIQNIPRRSRFPTLPNLSQLLHLLRKFRVHPNYLLMSRNPGYTEEHRVPRITSWMRTQRSRPLNLELNHLSRIVISTCQLQSLWIDLSLKDLRAVPNCRSL